MDINEYDKTLLETLKEGSKYLHMGSSPVLAIESAFKMCGLGLTIMADNDIHITQKGLEELEATNESD